jgi:hypothetical protein
LVLAELATTADGEGMPRVATMADESTGDRNSSESEEKVDEALEAVDDWRMWP